MAACAGDPEQGSDDSIDQVAGDGKLQEPESGATTADPIETSANCRAIPGVNQYR
jgi:hypothetical protein